MFELHNLQLQLQNLKFLFSDALTNAEVSIDELRKIRDQMHNTKKLIAERKAFLSGRITEN